MIERREGMHTYYEKTEEKEMDKEALLTELMNEYGNGVLKLIFSYVHQQDIAEDLAQEVFVKVYQKIDQFEQRASLKTWLYRIAINSSKDYLKSWHTKNVQTSEEGNMIEHMVDLRTPESNLIERTEEEELVTKVLSLPLMYKEVIYLYYYEEYSIQEISELLQINKNTVKTRLFQARKKLKQSFVGGVN